MQRKPHSRFLSCSDRYSTVLVAEVTCDWLLTALTTCCLDFVSIRAKEKANFEDSADALYLVSQSSNIPDAVFSANIFASVYVGLGEQWLEWCVYDVETLICLNRTSLRKSVLSESWLDGAQELELAHDGRVRDWSDFDWDRRPLCDELLLVLAVV